MAEEGAHMDENQNAPVSVFHRLASFPLIQSAYQIASFAYGDVKNVNPVVGYVCDLSERGVRVAGDLAAFGASPILKVMEPQITAANNVALRLVDELENKLPILDQSADEVVSELREKLVGGVRTVTDQALDRMLNVLDRTQAMASESYQTLSATTSFIGSLEVRDMVKATAYLVVTQAEELVDRFLPEESDKEPESSSSEEIDEVDDARFSLVYRSRQVVRSIIRRSWRRLWSFMERYWDFLQSSVSLLLSILTQVRLCVQGVLRSVLPHVPFKEEAEQKATGKKKKAKAQSRSGRSPREVHSNFLQDSVFLVSPSGRRLASDTDRVRVRSQERRQSLDSSYYPSQIEEDIIDKMFYP